MVGLIFGRFNPPTIGHEMMIAKAKGDLKNDPLFVFISKTQDKKKNPLDVDTKEKILSVMFRGVRNLKFVKCNDKIRTIIEALKFLNVEYDRVTVYCGSDRKSQFETLINKYNGKEYDFSEIIIKSVGERDPDDDGVSGMSGTKMREFAIDGDFDKFRKGISKKISDEMALDIMASVKNNLK